MGLSRSSTQRMEYNLFETLIGRDRATCGRVNAVRELDTDTMPWYQADSSIARDIIKEYGLKILKGDANYFAQRIQQRYEESCDLLVLMEKNTEESVAALKKHTMLTALIWSHANQSYGMVLSRLESVWHLQEVAAYAAHYLCQHPASSQDRVHLLDIGFTIQQKCREQVIPQRSIMRSNHSELSDQVVELLAHYQD